ncbi:universal stress protein [Frigidibacter sp. RF13]|nr:universal stress protein [Frigidibacter sp. RF13]MCY1125910.1 universal stress protein [Frigidibacter sp. RF13]
MAQVACPVLLACAPTGTDYGVVVAAIDFSPASAAAVRTAALLVAEARLGGVHALHVPYRGLIAPSTAEALSEEARSAEATLRKARDLPAHFGPIAMIEGVVDQVVAAALARDNADLLALGAHARAGVGGALLGGFATRILRDPPADPLIARAG